MSTANILPGAFGEEPAAELLISPQINDLVHTQIAALLMSSPSFAELPRQQQAAMRQNLEKIAAYTAALVHDDWHQSRKLGQTPVVRKTKTVEYQTDSVGRPLPIAPAHPARPARVQAVAARQLDEPGAAEFAPRAAGNVAKITESTLNAIAFPTFVADLIKGTFNAIVDASIQQMEAFGELLSNVAKTVDDFMHDNISDNPRATGSSAPSRGTTRSRKPARARRWPSRRI